MTKKPSFKIQDAETGQEMHPQDAAVPPEVVNPPMRKEDVPTDWTVHPVATSSALPPGMAVAMSGQARTIIRDLAPVASATPEPAKRTRRAPPGRPSLDVAMDTWKNLQDRVQALCDRVRGWQGVEAVADAAEEFRAAGSALGRRLAEAKLTGYKVKSTKKSRMRARLSMGSKVVLDDDVKRLYSTHYFPAELEDVTVTGFDEASDGLWVKIGQREGLLPVPVSLGKVRLP